MSGPMTNDELTDALKVIVDSVLELSSQHHGHHVFNGNAYRPTASIPVSDRETAIVQALHYTDPRVVALVRLKLRLMGVLDGEQSADTSCDECVRE